AQNWPTAGEIDDDAADSENQAGDRKSVPWRRRSARRQSRKIIAVVVFLLAARPAMTSSRSISVVAVVITFALTVPSTAFRSTRLYLNSRRHRFGSRLLQHRERRRFGRGDIRPARRRYRHLDLFAALGTFGFLAGVAIVNGVGCLAPRAGELDGHCITLR